MTNIAIVGCNGKMGYFVASAVKENPEAQTLFGIDAFGENKHDFAVYKSFDEVQEKPDVIIDFSNPAALDGMLAFAEKHSVPCVICTTGYSTEQVEKIKAAGEKIAIFYSGNMSLGINLLIELSKQAAKVLPQEPQYIYDRHTMRRKRTKNEIGIHSVRGGTIVGEHEVIFAGHDEVVTITHQAQSKEVFAVGAVNAAVFLAKQGAGMYSMSDLLADKF